MGSGLYIHIPFCKSKCHYCDFLSFADSEDKMEAYIDAVISEAGIWKEEYKDVIFLTVYIGGGTPSFLHNGMVAKLMNTLRRSFLIDPDAEISIEANPGTITMQKLKEYKVSGINRISMGLQSTNDKLLGNLGRIHSFTEFENGFELVRSAGYDNISIDLIYGLPEQSVEDWAQTLNNICMLELKHISCYGLKIEEGTPLHTDFSKGRLPLPTEEETLEMTHAAQDILERHGYMRYEISNYARKGFECRHNLNYWDCGEYLSLGLGAHSCMRSKATGTLLRWENARVFEDYIGKINQKIKPLIKTDPIDTKGEVFEYVMLRLRLAEGISYREFKSRFQSEIFDIITEQKITKLCDEGLAKSDPLHFYLTPRGMDVQNQIILYLMPN